MPSISSTIHVPHLHNSGSSKWPRIALSLPMSSSFSSFSKSFSLLQCMILLINFSVLFSVRTTDFDFLIPKKKKEVSVQLSTLKPPVSRRETVRFCNFNLGRFQPSPHEMEPHDRFEFGDFIAREAFLDEEYWVSFLFFSFSSFNLFYLGYDILHCL